MKLKTILMIGTVFFINAHANALNRTYGGININNALGMVSPGIHIGGFYNKNIENDFYIKFELNSVGRKMDQKIDKNMVFGGSAKIDIGYQFNSDIAAQVGYSIAVLGVLDKNKEEMIEITSFNISAEHKLKEWVSIQGGVMIQAMREVPIRVASPYLGIKVSYDLAPHISLLFDSKFCLGAPPLYGIGIEAYF